jgi:dihydroorotate dehydrogenase
MAKTLTNKPILLKIAPDMEVQTAIELCKTAINSGAAGIIDDTLTADDMSALREVLQDEHSRGMTPVSVYKQDEIIHDDFAE